MRYHNITKDDMRNGDGLRVVLWVAGCNHNCPNCQNPETHDKNGGIPFDKEAMNELLNDIDKDYIEGLTFSGGDPLYPDNREEVTKIAKIVKEKFPSKNIWCYTGYLYEQVKDLEIMKYIDILVDGPFIQEFNDNNLHWVGSSNQRVLDVKPSLEKGEVILHQS